MNINTGYTHKI